MRAQGVSNKETATRWFRVAVEQARLLRLSAPEYATLAVEYATSTEGHESNDAIRAELEEALTRMAALPQRTPDDQELIALLRVHLVFFLYTAKELDAARTVARDGIAALEPGPPTPGRARLRARLGWTYWRGGPLEEAPPILRQAIDEARACGASDVERLAIHELAVAVGMLGDLAKSETLVLNSLELARAAADHWLLSRCYINVVAVRSGNGATTDVSMPLALEGLDRAHRSADHVLASWIGQNVADRAGVPRAPGGGDGVCRGGRG